MCYKYYTIVNDDKLKQKLNNFMKKLNKMQTVICLLSIIALVFMGVKAWESAKKPNSSMREGLRVILYVKEGCRYCMMAEELLRENDIDYEAIDLSFDRELQKKLVNQTGQTTVPYIFINNKFIGGYKNLLDFKKKDAL